jgi:hypothetical protein
MQIYIIAGNTISGGGIEIANYSTVVTGGDNNTVQSINNSSNTASSVFGEAVH